MRSRSLLIMACLLAATALAGCAGSDDGGGADGPPARTAHCVEGDALTAVVEVDNARPEPGDEVQFSISLRNTGDAAAPVPENVTLQVVDPNGTLVAEAPSVTPRFDMPDTVEPGETVFMRRESLLVPGGAPPGAFQACASGGNFTGVTPFHVYAPPGSDNGTGDGGGGGAAGSGAQAAD